MKLFIFDKGDAENGFPSTHYVIECPFEAKSVSDVDLELFQEQALDLYKQYTEGRTTAMYDYEIEDETNAFEEE